MPCPTCGQPIPSPHTLVAHEQRVLTAIQAAPDASWRTIMRATKLRTAEAQQARDRLLASGRLVLVVPAHGAKGARYRVANDESAH